MASLSRPPLHAQRVMHRNFPRAPRTETSGAQPRGPFGKPLGHRHALDKTIDAQRRGETGCAAGGQNVVRADIVVAQGDRRKESTKNGRRVFDLFQLRLIRFRHDLRMLGRAFVDKINAFPGSSGQRKRICRFSWSRLRNLSYRGAGGFLLNAFTDLFGGGPCPQ